MIRRPPRSTLFPSTPLFRSLLYAISGDAPPGARLGLVPRRGGLLSAAVDPDPLPGWLTEADVDVYTREFERTGFRGGDRKSTRLNSSHSQISYAVFCLKKKQ